MKKHSFVTYNESHEIILTICGKEYNQPSEAAIEDAIEIAGNWKSDQVSFDRIMWLRAWIQRAGEQEHLDIPENLNSIKACKKWIDELIKLEFMVAKLPELETIGKANLKRNEAIFGD